MSVLNDGHEEASALSGHLVVELGDRVAVGSCGSLLAQLGAEVVLVESAPPRTDNKWQSRASVAAGKRSLVINRDAAADLELLRRLVAAADVVVISSDLSADDRMLWEAHRPAGQIVCDVTAFGHSGPLAGVPASEALVEAYAGTAETTGRRDAPPVLLGAPLLEMETAVYAASAIIAALRVRRMHGFGQQIDMALYDVGVNALLAFLSLPFTGRVATRDGNRHLALAPWNAFQARDGWLQICAPTGDQWARLCTAMGVPELSEDPRFGTPTSRLEHTDEIDRIVGAWVADRTVADCVATLAHHVIPNGPIVPVAELREEPNIRHRGMVRQATDPVSGRDVALPGCPVGPAPRPSIPAPDADRGIVQQLVARAVTADQSMSGDVVSSARPLDGVRVVEIGMNTVAPLAGRQLGALGADVIKIEPPRGDVNRVNGPLRADGESHVFALSNTDKRGLVLDLRRDADKKVLWDVLASADVVIENLKPGSLGRLGFGRDEVRGKHPQLIYCSVNGFGHDSAYPGRPALDTVVQAMSGLMSTTMVDGVPTKAGISVSDQIGGLFGLLGVLAALQRREQFDGSGSTLDLAMHDGSAWMTHPLWNGVGAVSARILQVADGFVAVDGDDDTVSAAIDPAKTRAMTRDELVDRLASVRGCAVAPVLTVDEVLAHPQTAARGLLLEVPTSDGDRWTVLGSPLRLLSTPALVSTAMPRLGVLDPDLATEFGPSAPAHHDGSASPQDALAGTGV